MSIQDDLLVDLPYYKYLSLSQKEYLKKNTFIKKSNKGDILFQSGENCLGMSHIIEGKLRVYIISEEGREVTLYHIVKGDNCVMSASCVINQITFDTVIEAEEDSEILVVNSSAFRKLSEENIYVKEFMHELATDRFSKVMFVMQEVLFYGFDRRLANFLVSEASKNNSLVIKMTQEEIAKNVNSAREVVARMLKRFSSDNLIELKHGQIIIKNLDELKKIK